MLSVPEDVHSSSEQHPRLPDVALASGGYAKATAPSPCTDDGASASSIGISVGDSSCSERSIGSDRGCLVEVIHWDELRLGSCLQPYRRYAHCREDIYLLSAFLELSAVNDIDGDSVKLLLRAIKLLHLCSYSWEDLCSFLAHASAYFVDTFELCGVHMDACEVGNVLVTLMFIAHCYVQDETCPLRVWHQHLFRKYCPLKTLNVAILRLLKIRNHILRLPTEDLETRFNFLQAAMKKPWSQRERVRVGGPESNGQAILSKVRGIKKYR